MSRIDGVSFFALIYCFLSTCLGVRLRRADLWDALQFNHPDARRRALRDTVEEFEMRRSAGPGQGFF